MPSYTCTDPDCEAVTDVRIFPATLVDPACPDRDTCVGCGADLDWESDVEPEPPEPQIDDLADEAYERAGDR